MAFKWLDHHVPRFLDSYRQYECLWNPGNSDYKGRTPAREKAYAAMLSDLGLPGLTVADIKAKIRTIRTRYAAELSKIRKSERSGAGTDDVYRPRLHWFKDADSFLRPVTTAKRSSSNLKVRGRRFIEGMISSEQECNIIVGIELYHRPLPRDAIRGDEALSVLLADGGSG